MYTLIEICKQHVCKMYFVLVLNSREERCGIGASWQKFATLIPKSKRTGLTVYDCIHKNILYPTVDKLGN